MTYLPRNFLTARGFVQLTKHNCGPKGSIVNTNSGFMRYSVLALLVLSVTGAFARRPGVGDDQDRRDNGNSAGGQWTQYRSEDRMTAEKRARFVLRANNEPDSDDSASIVLHCSDGELKLSVFHPNLRLARPNWIGFWGRPQMHVRVRMDDAHDEHNWNWINGHFLTMDKGTTRELLGARMARIEFQTPDGPRIAEFSPAGLDVRLVHDACGLTPKRP